MISGRFFLDPERDVSAKKYSLCTFRILLFPSLFGQAYIRHTG